MGATAVGGTAMADWMGKADSCNENIGSPVTEMHTHWLADHATGSSMH